MAVAAVAMCATMASCSSVEDKAKSYTEQIVAAEQAGDFEKALQLSKECQEWLATLSMEDQLKAIEASATVPLEKEEKAEVEVANDPNTKVLKLETELFGLGEYVSISSSSVVVKLEDLTIDGEAYKVMTATVPVTVKKSVVSASSYEFDAKVLDKNQNRLLRLPDFKIEAAHDSSTDWDYVLNAGKAEAVMKLSNKVPVSQWDADAMAEWENFRSEGVTLALTLDYESQEFWELGNNKPEE